ncbi:MbtH family protein [Streptomyces beigongshangae]|uniref:MbtH family protein n=1 Tax=Streptomyces beigongshangae TaxID=2841597 RepID=UPI001C866631|nr:MbtH family NRPS accessory protein [Streptomyces sp. REN17]
MSSELTDTTVYRVVLNAEEQYSIWRAGRELPAGWSAEGTEGTREECLARINDVWSDMRPASLRRRMESQNAAA